MQTPHTVSYTQFHIWLNSKQQHRHTHTHTPFDHYKHLKLKHTCTICCLQPSPSLSRYKHNNSSSPPGMHFVTNVQKSSLSRTFSCLQECLLWLFHLCQMNMSGAARGVPEETQAETGKPQLVTWYLASQHLARSLRGPGEIYPLVLCHSMERLWFHLTYLIKFDLIQEMDTYCTQTITKLQHIH